MRSVSLQDESLFLRRVNRTLYLLFKNRSDDFLEMIKDQTPAFWIGFVISFYDLHWRLRNTEFVLRTRNDVDVTQVFFINFHDLLVGDRPERIVTFVSDVVATARYSKFMNCLETMQMELHNVAIKIDGMVSFERLFGDRREMDTLNKVYQTHKLHILAVGALLTVFEHWLAAEPCRKVDWVEPFSWSMEPCPNHLYQHLRKRWGQQLLKMLPVQGNISWWGSSAVMDYRTETLLSQAFLTHHGSSSGILRVLEMNDKNEKLTMWTLLQPGFPVEFMCLTTVRQLFFPDCGIIFHPYAQLPACLHSEVIGSCMWSSKHGVKGVFADALWNKGFNMCEVDGKIPGNLFCDMLDIHVEVKKAIQLDANFHDSVALQTGWTSPDTVARLLWNMPLCIKWLEWVVIKTNKFETVFLPFCHFPVRKKVAGVMEGMLAKLSHETRLLAKAAIIVAEKIWMHEEDRNKLGRCRYSRSLLKFCLERLVPKMEFFNEGRCYSMLKFVLEEAWTKEERQAGQISAGTSKNDFCYVRDGQAADINIDFSFSQNYRSMCYWNSVKKPSGFEFSKQQYMEATSKIEEFKKQIKNPQALPKSKARCSLKYDIEYYRKYNPDPLKRDLQNKPFTIDDVLGVCACLHIVGFLTESLLHLVQMDLRELTMPGVADRIPGMEFVHLFNPLTCQPACEFVPEKQSVKQQDMLGLLHMMETHRMILDVSARVCATMGVFLPGVSCPSPKFFSIAYDEMSLLPSGAAVTSIDQATGLLDKLGSVELIADEATLAEPGVLNHPLLLEDPVKELECKRVWLLQAVSRAQYEKEMDKSGKYCKYPLLSCLEYRFVEELAALRKSRDMGHRQAEQRLVQLLSSRLNQMTVEYRQWREAGVARRAEEASHADPNPVVVATSACSLMVRILAVLVQLKPVFSAYLSPFRTMHPFSETSEALVLRLCEMLVTNIKRTYTPLPSARLCVALTASGLDYLEHLLEDCLRVWSVPELCSDPSSIPQDGMEHAQLVHVGMTQLLLLLTHRELTVGVDRVPQKTLLAAFSSLVEAGTLIRLEGLGSCSGVLEEVKSRLLEVYGAVVPFAPALQQVNWSRLPNTTVWRGFSEHWLDCLRSARTGDLSIFFKRIQFDEFMAKISEKPMKCMGGESEGGSGDAVPTEQVGTAAESPATGTRAVDGEDKPGSAGQHGDEAKGKDVSSSSSNVAAESSSPSSLQLNCCFGCQKKEAVPRTFKECDKCISEQWFIVRVYCSPECCASDWERRHGQEHSVGEQESDYGPDDSLDID